jgi:hypothetical protein
MISLALIALASAPLAAEPAPADRSDVAAAFADIDRQFICPESLSDAAARQAALSSFTKSVAAVAPSITAPQLLAFRRKVLTRHGCTQTLQSLEAADRAVEAGHVEVQAWLSIGHLPGLEVFVSTSYLKPFLDPRRSTEPAVDTYDKLVFEGPRQTNVTHVTYDEVISHNVFYCRIGSFALLENDYFLAGTSVLKDASPVEKTFGATKVYAIEQIHAETPNAAAARWTCSAADGLVAMASPQSASSGPATAN